ncbi:MAG: DUF4352 domain-containing protein [Coriobacteriales bacterium]|nr:DUF4352 domain-containing protein [Coriobacteriales bacterium]
MSEQDYGTPQQSPENMPPQPGTPPQTIHINTTQQVVVADGSRKGNALGVAALVLGIIAIIGSWIPFLNIFSALLSFLAIALAIAGIILGVIKKRSIGPAIAGLALGVVTTIIFVATYASVASLMTDKGLDVPGALSQSTGTVASEGGGVEGTSEPEPSIAALGTLATTEKFEITINSSSKTGRIDNGQYLHYEPDAGNEYVVISVSLANISNEMESFNVSDFQLLTLDDSVKYSPTSLIVTSGDETFFWIDSMNPGSSKTGNIVFEISQGIELSTLKLWYNDTWSFNGASYYFAIQ